MKGQIWLRTMPLIFSERNMRFPAAPDVCVLVYRDSASRRHWTAPRVLHPHVRHNVHVSRVSQLLKGHVNDAGGRADRGAGCRE